jgi:hypothetical protein
MEAIDANHYVVLLANGLRVEATHYRSESMVGSDRVFLEYAPLSNLWVVSCKVEA